MKRRLPLALAVTGLFVAGSANALVIDSFSAAEMVLESPHNLDDSTAASPIPGVIGNARKFILSQVSGATSPRHEASADINADGSSQLYANNDTGVNSTVTVIWDGNASTPHNSVVTNGLKNADLTVGNGTGFLFTIPFIDQNVNLALTVWNSQGTSKTVTKNAANSGAQVILMPFSEFGGIDFTDIGAIRMVLSAPTSWDGQIDLIGTNGTPLPGTLLLMGAGLLGLASRGRRTGSSA